jgi:hypothetical protein
MTNLFADTGSSILCKSFPPLINPTFSGVPMKGCWNKGDMSQYCKKRKSLYDPHKSRSAREVKKIYHVAYGIGDTVGFVFEDSFAVSF